MYQFVKAVMRKRGKNETWKEIDSAYFLSRTLLALFTDYVDGYITFTNAALGAGNYYVDFNSIRRMNTRLYNHDFSTWLGIFSADGKVFTHLPQEPVFTTNSCLYADAWRARYHIQRAFPGDPLDIVGKPREALSDLLLTKENIDYDELYDYALTSVNGFFHPNVSRDEGLVVRGGAISADKAQSNHVGLVGFVGVGKTTEYPITLDMIQRISSHIPYSETCYINLGVDLTNKSLIMVFGGYLHLNDETFDIINYDLGIVKVNVRKLDLVKRVLEMRRYLDISHLQLTQTPSKAGAILVDEVQSEEFALRFLTLLQSYAVVVDTPHLVTSSQVLGKVPKIPGRYSSPTEPAYPVKSQTGRFVEYWARQEYDDWTLMVGEQYLRNYLFETTTYEGLTAVNETQEYGSRYIPSLTEFKIEAITRS